MAPPSIPLNLTQPLILVVDDDDFVRPQLSQLLAADGYRVIQAADGAACLAAYREHHPDLVLLDIVLPDIDGFECCTQLHQLSGGQYTPIVMMTGLTDDLSIHQAYAVGVVDYVIKPVRWNLLSHRLSLLLKQTEYSRRLESKNQQLTRLATLDSLTQIPNRRCFDEHLDAMWRQMVREADCLAIILGDVDFFKAYNDAYGHIAGDRCLKAIAECLRQCCQRPLDLVARYGGEEFGVVMPKTNLEGALNVATKMQEAIAEMNLPHQNSKIADRITMSFGAAALSPTTDSIPETLLELADRALYRAKDQGRACIVGLEPDLYPSQPDSQSG